MGDGRRGPDDRPMGVGRLHERPVEGVGRAGEGVLPHAPTRVGGGRRGVAALRRRMGCLLLGLGLLLGAYSLLVAGARWWVEARLPAGGGGARGSAATDPAAGSTALADRAGLADPLAPVDPAGADPSVEALLATAGIPARLPSPTPDAARVPGPVPDWIRIPSLGVDSPVLPVGWSRPDEEEGGELVWRTADFGAGLHAGSARLGEAGNTVISGHNNIGDAVFRRLAELEPGETVVLSARGRDWSYRVERRFIVPEADASEARRRRNARWIDPSADERLTLVSCYPPWGNSHRVIVVARPAGSPTAGATP